MTRVVLIKAGPTQWDAEERIGGNFNLPLTEEGRAKIVVLLDGLPQIDAVYRCAENDACDEVAKMIARPRNLKPRDNAQLDAWNLGLWQGLRMEDLRQRYPTVIEQWEESPATVLPPGGESFLDCIDRLRGALRAILRRNRTRTVALPLRPSAIQIVGGLLRRETPEQIAPHLQNDTPMETIEVGEDVLKEL
jgi:broad specificity phosphatase PhoE